MKSIFKQFIIVTLVLLVPMATAEAIGKLIATLPYMAKLTILWAFIVTLLGFIIIKTEEVKNEIFKSNHNRK